MSRTVCFWCKAPLVLKDDILVCSNTDCPACDEKYLHEELIRTRKALAFAIDVIQTVAKMSDKLSRKYGDTLVEQLDTIQAFCWEEGYILTHDEDFKRAEQINKKEEK